MKARQNILNFSGNSNPLILVHTNMGGVMLSHDVNIMLTPQFYTLKREVLPLKYSYQAKRIAPSLFEGLLESGGSYEYLVWKEEEFWVFLAYDLEKITGFLEEKGFDLGHVSKLFFAQQAPELFDKPLALGDEEALLVLDGSVVVVPQRLLGDEMQEKGTFERESLPKKGITLQSAYGSIIGLKDAVRLAIIFCITGIIFVVEGMRYSEGAHGIQDKVDELLVQNASLASRYTRMSVATKYQQIDTLERKKRDKVRDIGRLIIPGVSLETLEMSDTKFSALLVCSDIKSCKRVETRAKQYHLKTTPITEEKSLKIEGIL